jgi:BRCT domain type II-containing protein
MALDSPEDELNKLIEQMLKNANTPEFIERVRKRIAEENKRYAEEERRLKPTWEDRHKPYDI